VTDFEDTGRSGFEHKVILPNRARLRLDGDGTTKEQPRRSREVAFSVAPPAKK
jgi:hypothetical protein